MKVLVTGATGFIGFHIVEELAKQGLSLKAAYRPGESFQGAASEVLIDGLDLESFSLDITDRRAVAKALQGCQLLFHAENFLSFRGADKAKLYAINHLGTKNLMEAALAQGIEKVVYTSGMETLMAPAGHEQASESDGVSMEDLKSDFEKSRLMAEREIQRLKQQGLPVILVHPTVGLGTGDRGTTPFGKFLQRYLERKVHYYLDTGFNLVDVVDVAKGHLLAAKRGQVGQRYILGNQNVYMLELLRNLERLTEIPAPKTALPFFLAKWGNRFSQKILRRPGGAPNKLLNRLRRPLFYDASLAREALGMPQTNVWDALSRQIMDMIRKK